MHLFKQIICSNCNSLLKETELKTNEEFERLLSLKGKYSLEEGKEIVSFFEIKCPNCR